MTLGADVDTGRLAGCTETWCHIHSVTEQTKTRFVQPDNAACHWTWNIIPFLPTFKHFIISYKYLDASRYGAKLSDAGCEELCNFEGNSPVWGLTRRLQPCGFSPGKKSLRPVRKSFSVKKPTTKRTRFKWITTKYVSLTVSTLYTWYPSMMESKILYRSSSMRICYSYIHK